MKNWFPLAPVTAAVLPLFASSCEMYSGGYESPYEGAGGYGGGYPTPYYSHPYSPYAAVSRPYGYGGYSRGCPVCHYNPCRCRHSYGGYRSHDSGGGRGHNSSCGSGKPDTRHLRIVGGSTGSKATPRGTHSLSWYKSRGYDTSRLAFKDDHGHAYRKSGGSSHKSGSKGKSKKSKH